MKNKPKYLDITKDDVIVEVHYNYRTNGKYTQKFDIQFYKTIKNVPEDRVKYILSQLYGKSLKDEIWNRDIDDDEI